MMPFVQAYTHACSLVNHDFRLPLDEPLRTELAPLKSIYRQKMEEWALRVYNLNRAIWGIKTIVAQL
jgi:hypothetical protein